MERAESTVSSLRISGGYLPAIGGSSASACIDISAYISSDKGERKDIEERSGTEVYEEKLPGKEENAVSAWRERCIPKAW